MEHGDITDASEPSVRYGTLRIAVLVLLGLLLAALAGIAILLWSTVDSFFGSAPDPEVVATSTLEGLREQNVLVPFSARYVGVVTSTESRLGGVLKAEKTLILPGTVRYELDLSQLDDDDLEWDAETGTLKVVLPDIRINGPEVDLKAMREYRDGETLMRLTGAEARLDQSNRDAAVAQILEQAQEDTPVRLAREAARKAVTTNLELPLRAAGFADARVETLFAHELAERQLRDFDRSRRPEDVLREKREAEKAGN